MLRVLLKFFQLLLIQQLHNYLLLNQQSILQFLCVYKRLLYFAALNVVRKGGILHEYYNNLITRGMKKNKALTAVSRKLLRILFALVRNKRNYIPCQEVKLAA